MLEDAKEGDEEDLEIDMDSDEAEEADEEAEDEEEEMEEISEEDMSRIIDYMTDLEEDAAFDNRHSSEETSDRLSDQQPQHDNNELLDLDDLGTGYDDEQIASVVLDEVKKELGLDEAQNPNKNMSEIDDILDEIDEGGMSQFGGDSYMDDEHMSDEYMDDYMDEPMDDYMDDHMGDYEAMDEPMDDYMDEPMDDEMMDYMEDLDEGDTEFEIDLREYGVTDVERDPMDPQPGIGDTYLDVVNDLLDGGDNVDNDFDPEGPGGLANMTQPQADPLGESDELDLSGVLREEEDEGARGVQKLRRENRKLRKERDKALRAAKSLKQEVRSSKLVGKKLLFTNKLFNNFSLNSKQRSKVKESFERADTEREVEMTFANLADAFRTQQGSAANTTKQQKLDESINRASNNNRRNNASMRTLNEETDQKERFQELAGIL
jgi:hypothetical protein